MSTPKEEVRKLLEQLPDDSSLEDIQYHIYVRGKIADFLLDGVGIRKIRMTAQIGRSVTDGSIE
jgi:hypothetical protein